MGRRRKKKGFWHVLILLIRILLLPFVLFYDLAKSMERDRKKRGRHSGVMSSGPRRKRR